MTYTRPSNVPDDATAIPPVQMSPLQVLIASFQASGQPLPPWLPKIAGPDNVQLATIQSVMMQNAHLNLNAYQRDEQAMKDWNTNAQRAKDLGLPVPPQPLPTPKIVDNVVFANPDGSIVNDPSAYNGSHVAWMWQTWDATLTAGPTPTQLPPPPAALPAPGV